MSSQSIFLKILAFRINIVFAALPKLFSCLCESLPIYCFFATISIIAIIAHFSAFAQYQKIKYHNIRLLPEEAQTFRLSAK